MRRGGERRYEQWRLYCRYIKHGFNDPHWPNDLQTDATPGPTTSDGSSPHLPIGPGSGITGGKDFTDLLMALDDALGKNSGSGGFDGIRSLTGLAPTFCKLEVNSGDSFVDVCSGNTLDLTPFSGKVVGSGLDTSTQLYIKLADGLNVIDINVGGTAGTPLDIENASIIIDGKEDSTVVLRVQEDRLVDVDNANIVLGKMGIMNMNVLWYSDTRGGLGTTFDFDNAILDGMAFWALGDEKTQIQVDNSQGCIQFIARTININNARYENCSFKTSTVTNSEPTTLSALAIGLGLFAYSRRRRLVS